jgi:hypothetical protein
METFMRIVLFALISLALIGFTGCKKTETQPAPTQPKPAAQKTPETATPAAPATAKTETPATTASQLTAMALDAVPMDTVKAEIAKMGVDQLRDKALEYKKAIDAKKIELTQATLKLRDIVTANPMSSESTELQNNIKTLTKTVTDLKDRFQLYYNKIKDLGGNLSGLEMPQ